MLEELDHEEARWQTKSSSTPIRMSRGRIARWMLEEVGQPYRTEVLDYCHDDEGARLSRRQSRWARCRRCGTAISVVTETAAICAYLADAFPQARLAPPPGDRLRGPYFRWLFFSRRTGGGRSQQ